MERRAKGKLRSGRRASEVRAKSAKGRLRSGATPRHPRAHSALPSPPTFKGPGTRLRPGAAERGAEASGRGGQREGGRFLPGPWERGAGGGVEGAGSPERRRRR